MLFAAFLDRLPWKLRYLTSGQSSHALFRGHGSSVQLLLLETRFEDFVVLVRWMSLLLLRNELQ